RDRLRAIISVITGESGKIFRGRGRRATSGPSIPVWARRMAQNKIHYEVGRAHPLLESFTDGLNETQLEEFLLVLQALERAMPVDAIFSDMASSPSDLSLPVLADAEITA